MLPLLYLYTNESHGCYKVSALPSWHVRFGALRAELHLSAPNSANIAQFPGPVRTKQRTPTVHRRSSQRPTPEVDTVYRRTSHMPQLHHEQKAHATRTAAAPNTGHLWTLDSAVQTCLGTGSINALMQRKCRLSSCPLSCSPPFGRPCCPDPTRYSTQPSSLTRILLLLQLLLPQRAPRSQQQQQAAAAGTATAGP